MSRYPYGGRPGSPAPILTVVLGAPGTTPMLAAPALLDSGADRSVVPRDLPEALGLPAISSARVRTVVGEQRVVVHALRLEIEGHLLDLRVFAAGEQVLIGRDALRYLVVTLDGPAEELEIRDG